MTQPATTRRHTLLARMALAILVTGLYAAASVRNGFIYDDYTIIVEGKAVTSLHEFLEAFKHANPGPLPYYRPIVMLTLWIQKAVHGLDPAPYHLFNAALAGLLFWAASGLLMRPSFRSRPWLALLAALAFVVHPATSSCVYAADSGRETLLPVLCVVAAVSAYLRPGIAWLGASLFLLTLALFGKEQAVVVPFLCLAADLLGLSDQPRRRAQCLWRALAVFSVLAAYLVLRHSLFRGTDLDIAILQDPSGPLWAALYALQTTLLPTAGLAYEPPLSTWLSTPRLVTSLVIGIALLVSALRAAPHGRQLTLFWALWWALSLLPTAGVVRQEVPFDERYICMSILAVAGTAAIFPSVAWSRTRVRRSSVALFALAGLALLAVSLYRSRFFLSNEAYCTQWLRTNPRSPQAHHGVAQAHAARGNHALALEHLRTATQIAPKYPSAWITLGKTCSALGLTQEARHAFESALRLDPNHLAALNNLAVLHAQQGACPLAASLLYAALRVDPESALTYGNLGNTLILMKQPDAALRAYRRAVSLDPNLMEPQAGLGSLLATQGDVAAARPHLQRALDLATAAGRQDAAAILSARLATLPP